MSPGLYWSSGGSDSSAILYWFCTSHHVLVHLTCIFKSNYSFLQNSYNKNNWCKNLLPPNHPSSFSSHLTTTHFCHLPPLLLPAAAICTDGHRLHPRWPPLVWPHSKQLPPSPTLTANIYREKSLFVLLSSVLMVRHKKWTETPRRAAKSMVRDIAMAVFSFIHSFIKNNNNNKWIKWLTNNNEDPLLQRVLQQLR